MSIRHQNIDQAEADRAIQLYNETVNIWNHREFAGAPGERGPLPILEHDFHTNRRRLFEDVATGHVYEIRLKKPAFLFVNDSHSNFRREPLDLENVKLVRRVISMEESYKRAESHRLLARLISRGRIRQPGDTVSKADTPSVDVDSSRP